MYTIVIKCDFMNKELNLLQWLLLYYRIVGMDNTQISNKHMTILDYC